MCNVSLTTQCETLIFVVFHHNLNIIAICILTHWLFETLVIKASLLYSFSIVQTKTVLNDLIKTYK